MKERKIIINNKLGLHARAAAKIVTLTNKFDSIINIANGEKIADAKSIMKILMLSAPKGTEVKITADGKDELTALDSLEELISLKIRSEIILIHLYWPLIMSIYPLKNHLMILMMHILKRELMM